MWHDGRCSWVGAAAEPERFDAARVPRRSARVLYDGTAGIGLFLAQVAAATGDEAARRTAAGALRHAVERAGEGDGLHAGALGVAWAARAAARCSATRSCRGGARARARRRPRAGTPAALARTSAAARRGSAAAGRRCADVISAGRALVARRRERPRARRCWRARP